MPKFPVDAPRHKVIRALELLGFEMVREREHIAMISATFQDDLMNTVVNRDNGAAFQGCLK